MNDNTFGLVLSGGGAKGAYEAGVIKALVEREIKVQAVAGASIGALNGAIVAASPDLSTAASRLRDVWYELANSSPLKAKPMPHYLMLLASAGLSFYGSGALGRMASVVTKIPGANLVAASMFSNAASYNGGILDSSPLHSMLNRYLDIDALQSGIDLYISVYPYPGLLKTFADIGLAEIGFKDNSLSEFLHVQSLSQEQQRTALLASAALPGIFDPQEINGAYYTDGGQGGWRKAQGNTPISPLLDAGIKKIIVTHLSDGSLWNRHDFPEASIIEIRPRKSITRGRLDLIGFNSNDILAWLEQGYEDAYACWERVEKPLQAISRLQDSFVEIDRAKAVRQKTKLELDAALSRLRNQNKSD